MTDAPAGGDRRDSGDRRRRGRPRLELDLTEVEHRLSLGFLLGEILVELAVDASRSTVERRIRERRNGTLIPPPPLRRCDWPGCYAYVLPLAPGCTRGHPLD
jgi:hypothetical protein